jgi:Ca2+-binding RTX toxin-like protein
VDEIIADILALDEEAGGFTNYEAPLTDIQDWYLDQIAATEGFSNVAYFLTDGFPNRWLDDDGNVAGTGGGFNPVALAQAIAAIPNVLDQDSGTLSGDDEVLLNAIGASNALESTLDLLDNTEVIDPGPPQVGEAQIVNLGDPSAVPDEFLVVGLGVGADEISGRDGDDIIFGDVPNSDALATAEGIDLPPGSGWFVFEALEAGQSPSSPDWDRGDTISYIRDPANQPNLIGAGRGEGDTIDGGAGDDVIFGQGGDDSLTGGPGADTFVYTLAADEDDDEILDFSTAEGDLLSYVNVTDAGSSGTIGIEDVVDSFVDGGGAGAVDTLVLGSGTTIMITDVSGILTDLASLDANSLINGV